ncbi:hypothetical protein GCM10025762_41120 [Haloechinothrix salitolerans]
MGDKPAAIDAPVAAFAMGDLVAVAIPVCSLCDAIGAERLRKVSSTDLRYSFEGQLSHQTAFTQRYRMRSPVVACGA